MNLRGGESKAFAGSHRGIRSAVGRDVRKCPRQACTKPIRETGIRDVKAAKRERNLKRKVDPSEIE